MHWLSKSNLAKNKKNGGMGFREFNEFNKALLEKHRWRLISKEGSLLEQIFKSRYYPRSNFLEAGPGFQSSYARRSMISAREVIQRGGRLETTERLRFGEIVGFQIKLNSQSLAQ